MAGIIISLAVLFALLVFLIYMLMMYNKFMRLDNAADATLGQIRVALKKRLDLLSELVACVKSYASFEKATLESITEMRSSVMEGDAKTVEHIQRETGKILGNIRAVVERYPELKTSETVIKLMDAATAVEDEIARHRYTYNNIVQDYNTMREVIPSNIIASLFSFERMDYLEFGEMEKPALGWKM